MSTNNHTWLRRLGYASLMTWLLGAASAPSFAMAQAVGAPGLLGRTIVVDPGHGGTDSGALGVSGTYEKDITLAIALDLTTLLRQSGARVVLTRDTDRDLATEMDRRLRQRQRGDLKGRVNVALASHPDLLLSIHCNASPSPSWYGAQTLYHRGNEAGKQAAIAIQDSFRDNLLPTTREAHPVDRLYILRRVHTSSVLAEVGFVSNPTEEQFLKADAYQQQVAMALYVGILRYFGQPPVKTGWWREWKMVFHHMKLE